MKRILVVADDFTGAAEIGGIAVEFGLRAQIAFGHLPRGSSEVLVIDTDSRHLAAGEAAERLRNVLGQVERSEFDLVFKKTDSVLRGAVAVELQTICEVLDFERCLLVPQNPSRGRTIEKGKYLIDGVELHRTSFADDPDFPARGSDVRDVLGGEVHHREVNESVNEMGITIGDGKNAGDLDWWALRLTHETLAAGGADFFSAILRRRGLVRSERAPIAVDIDRALFICGSASGQKERERLKSSSGCSMPRVLFDSGKADEASLEGWRAAIVGELRASGRAMVGVGHEVVPQRAGHVRQMLGEIAARVIRSGEVGALFIEGGATAAAVIQQLGWLDLAVNGELSGGVVVLHPLAKPGQVLVVKPGSYAWPFPLESLS